MNGYGNGSSMLAEHFWWDLFPLISLFALGMLGVLIFAVRSAIRGIPQSRWIVEKGSTPFLGHFVMEYFYWLTGPPTRWLVRRRVSPNLLTTLSVVLAVVAAVLLALGRFGAGGWMILASAILDGLDGRVARLRGSTSEAGAFWDSTADRISDLAIFLGFALYYRSSVGLLLLVSAALFAAWMVSYARAKAEASGIDCNGGVMQRHERVVYLGLGAGASPIVALLTDPSNSHPEYWLAVAALAIVGVFSSYTAVRRVWTVFHALKDRASGQAAKDPRARPKPHPRAMLRASNLGHRRAG